MNSIRARLHEIGAWSIKTNLNGEADVLACVPHPNGSGVGVFVAIEVKQPGKKPSPLQLAKLERWRKAGAIAFVCDNPDDVVDTFMREVSNRTSLRDFDSYLMSGT